MMNVTVLAVAPVGRRRVVVRERRNPGASALSAMLSSAVVAVRLLSAKLVVSPEIAPAWLILTVADAGRLVIRPSGTEPVIRVMAEGDDERLVSTVVGDIVEAVKAAAQAA